MPQITAENAAFSYENNTIVRSLSFTVNPGDYLCIIGENGSGKTTLIKGLLGLKRPSEGHIRLSDGLKPNEIGYLPQQTLIQKDFPADSFEVVLSGRLNRRGLRPFYGKADRAAALANMEYLNITGLRHRCFRELSGGQQQRVYLARALCAARKVLLLDEPVAGLDPTVTKDFYAQLARINKDKGMTIIMVSHDIHTALSQATHILHLHNTRAYFANAQDYAHSEQGRLFLGRDIS